MQVLPVMYATTPMAVDLHKLQDHGNCRQQVEEGVAFWGLSFVVL